MPEPARRALLVATSQYLDPSLPNLTGAVSDASELAEVLADEEVGGFAVQTVLDRPAHEVAAAIEEFLQACGHRDLVLLYFTGHGIKGMDGALYFAATDTRAKLLRASGVAASWVNEALDACRSRRQMVLLDCCHSGAFARGIKAGGQVGSTEQLSSPARAAGRGRVILTASDAIQFALERPQDDELVKSVFTTCVVRGLRTGDADVDSDGRITLEDLFEYVKEAVHRENPHQTPEMSAVSLSGEFVIATNPHARGRSRLPPALSAAVLSPAVHIREQAVGQLRDLLSMADDLELRQAVLQALALLLADDSRRVSTAAAKALEDTDEFAAQLRASSPPSPVREPPPLEQPLPPPEITPPSAPPPSEPPPAAPPSQPPPSPEPLPAAPPSQPPPSPEPLPAAPPSQPAPSPSPPPPRRSTKPRPALRVGSALVAAAAAAFVWFGLVNQPGADTAQQVPTAPADEEDEEPPGGVPPVAAPTVKPSEEPAPAAPPFAVEDLQWSATPSGVADRARVRAILWHDDRFIAVGQQMVGSETDALALTSSDGQQWTPMDTDALRAKEGDQSMRTIAAGPKGLIAVGSEGARPNQDAAVWLFDGDEIRQVEPTETMTTDHREMLSVVWDRGHDQYVAVGCIDDPFDTVCEQTLDGTPRAGVWTSPDGSQWRQVPVEQIEQADHTAMRDILQIADNLLVVVGYRQPGGEATREPALWTSTDGGQNWEWIDLPQPADSAGGALLRVVAHEEDGIIAGGYVAVDGWEPAIWYSADGREWDTQLVEKEPAAGHQVMEAVTAAGDGFVGAGRTYENDATHGVIWASADGKTWTRQQPDDSPGDGTVLRAVAASNDRVVAGGGTGADDVGRLRMWTGTPAE